MKYTHPLVTAASTWKSSRDKWQYKYFYDQMFTQVKWTVMVWTHDFKWQTAALWNEDIQPGI